MKLIIAGGRKYKFTLLDCGRLELLLPEITEVVSGCAPGADKCGELWAKANNIPVKPFPANWNDLSQPDARIKTRPDGSRYDAEEGRRRNRRMAQYADAVALFPGGAGTQIMFAEAKAAGIKIYDFRTEAA